MQFCPGCGFRIEKEAFCPSCGLEQVPLSDYPMMRQIPPETAGGRRQMPGVEDGDRPKKKGLGGRLFKSKITNKKQGAGERRRGDVEELQEQPDTFVSKLKSDMVKTREATKRFDEKDIKEHKAMAALAYCNVLVFVPLFSCKDSDYVKFHIRQGMNVFAATVLTFLVKSIFVELVEMTPIPEVLIKFLALVVSLPFYAVFIVLAGLSLLGLIYAAFGKAKELPYLGKFNLIGADDTAPVDSEEEDG